MPRTPDQNRRIRESTRAAIVDNAMTLFAQNGYAHTTVRHIADQAGISAGLMYHYFDSKGSLLGAVFDTCIGILNDAFNQAYTQSRPDERLGTLVRAMFTMLEQDREFWGLFYMLRNQPAIMNVLGDSFRLWTKRLRDLFVSELKAGGSSEPEIDALLLYSLVEGTIQQYLLDPANYPLSTVANKITEQFLSQKKPMQRSQK